MAEPPRPSAGNEPPVAALLLTLLLTAVACLVLELWPRAAAVPAVPGPATTAPSDAPAGARLVRRAAPKAPRSSPRPAADASTADAGPAALTLKKLQSLFDLTKLLSRNSAEAAADVVRYCAEAAKLPRQVFDDPPHAGPLRDAAYFLEPLVTWETHPPTEGLLALPPALVDRIRAAHGAWATTLTAADTAGVDFAWLVELESYDVWSLAIVGPVADSAATVDPLMAPIPDYRLLVDYAKLRLVRALADGDLATALAQVQHLADIVTSNDITIATAEATHLLRLEQPFLDAATQQGYPPVDTSAATPLDAADSDRFRDLTNAAVAFALPGVDPAVFQRAMACAPAPCAAVSDAAALHVELDRASEHAADDAFWSYAREQACDPALLDLVRASPSGSLEQVDGWLSGEPLPLEKLFGAKAP